MRSLIYLLRHGETDAFSPRRFLGQTELPLNDNGIRQATALGDLLRSTSFTHVFASPLCRAMHTASLVSGLATEAITPVAAFKEIDLGSWEGLTVDEVRQRYPGTYELRGLDLEQVRPEGGESFGDLAARCWPALQQLAEQFPGPLLIVAHAGVNRVLLSRIMKRPLQRLLELPQDHCAVNMLRSGRQGLEAVAVNLRGIIPAAHSLSTQWRGNPE